MIFDPNITFETSSYCKIHTVESFLSLECTQPLQEPQGLRYRGNLLPTHIALHPAILFLSREPFGSYESLGVRVPGKLSSKNCYHCISVLIQDSILFRWIKTVKTPPNKKPSGCWKCAARSIGIRCGGPTVEDDSTSANS